MSVFPPNYLYKLFALINMYPLLISLILYLSNTLDFPPNKKTIHIVYGKAITYLSQLSKPNQ